MDPDVLIGLRSLVPSLAMVFGSYLTTLYMVLSTAILAARQAVFDLYELILSSDAFTYTGQHVKALCILTCVLVLSMLATLRFRGTSPQEESRPLESPKPEEKPQLARITKLAQAILQSNMSHCKKLAPSIQKKWHNGVNKLEVEWFGSMSEIFDGEPAFPSDYVDFLSVTNGLEGIWDGSGAMIKFHSLNSIRWVELQNAEQSNPTGRQTTVSVGRDFLDAVVGEEIRSFIAGQMLEFDGRPFSALEIAITQNPELAHLADPAAAVQPSSVVYLLSPQAQQKITDYWAPLDADETRWNGAMLGRRDHYQCSYYYYFDPLPLEGGDTTATLGKVRPGWRVLQVHCDREGRRRCLLYPNFTAYLETLAMIAQESSDELKKGLGETYYKRAVFSAWVRASSSGTPERGDMYRVYDSPLDDLYLVDNPFCRSRGQ